MCVESLLIVLMVTLELLMPSALHSRVDIFLLSLVALIVALDDEELLVMVDHLRVDVGEVAVAEREEIDSVEDVGLAFTIVADEAVHLRRELQRSALNILVIDD